MVHLSQIKTPADIKLCSYEELTELAEEIRQEIVMTVARNGGHLASNLGVVELTYGHPPHVQRTGGQNSI